MTVAEHARTHVTHAVETVEGLRFTVCGRLASRKMRPQPNLRLTDVSCEVCWTVIAKRPRQAADA
jgi:hypothetical protein